MVLKLILRNIQGNKKKTKKVTSQAGDFFFIFKERCSNQLSPVPLSSVTPELGDGESLSDSDKTAICNHNGGMTKGVQGGTVDERQGRKCWQPTQKMPQSFWVKWVIADGEMGKKVDGVGNRMDYCISSGNTFSFGLKFLLVDCSEILLLQSWMQ